LRAAGKTLLIEVVGDSLRVEEMATPVSMEQTTEQESESPGIMAMFEFGGDDDDADEDSMVQAAD